MAGKEGLDESDWVALEIIEIMISSCSLKANEARCITHAKRFKDGMCALEH